MRASSKQERRQFTPEIEAEVLLRLHRQWKLDNLMYFRSTLRSPILDLCDSHTSRWDRATRELLIARPRLLDHPWASVCEDLLVQATHQYVDEALSQTSEPGHSEAVRRTLAAAEIQQVFATGRGLSSRYTEAEQRVLQRINRLLALAESPNQHEAEAATREAQRLMLRYNLDAQEDPRRPESEYGVRHIGHLSQRTSEAAYSLAAILQRHFFVEAVWVWSFDPFTGKEGRILEICGTPANLEMAAHVYAFVMQTAQRLWEEHRKQGGKEVSRDRPAFFAGVMDGLADKLAVQRQADRREGLVWQGDAGLKHFFDERHPDIESNGGSGGDPWNPSRMSGFAAGRNIVVHRPVQGASSPSGGRLLP